MYIWKLGNELCVKFLPNNVLLKFLYFTGLNHKYDKINQLLYFNIHNFKGKYSPELNLKEKLCSILSKSLE